MYITMSDPADLELKLPLHCSREILPAFSNFFFGRGGSSLLCEAFTSCSEQGLFFIAVCRLLTAAASLFAERGL